MKRETIKNILIFLKNKEGKELPNKLFNSMPIYELSMALLLGLVGGFGGVVGKWLINKTGWFNKDDK